MLSICILISYRRCLVEMSIFFSIHEAMTPCLYCFFLILVISPRHKQSSILLYFYLQQKLFLNEYRLEVKGYLRQGRTETIPSRQCKLFSTFDLELFFGLGQSIIDVVFWIQDWKGWFYHNKEDLPWWREERYRASDPYKASKWDYSERFCFPKREDL